MAENTTNHRLWLTPITVVSFIAVAVTGVIMLFEKRLPIHGLHQWMGLVFCAAGVFHLLLNWKPFVGYFRKRTAYAVMAVGILLSLGFLAADLVRGPPSHARQGNGQGQGQMERGHHR